MLGLPSSPTYCVATWPLAISWVEHLVVGDEAALAVADGDGVGVVQAALRQPRGQIGRDASAHQTALVTTDGVERQRGRIGRGVDDVAVGHQTELDQGLEAVADAQHQAVAGLAAGRGLPR